MLWGQELGTAPKEENLGMSRYTGEDQDLEVGSGENWESLWLQFQFPRSNIGIVAAGRDSAALPTWQLHLPLPVIRSCSGRSQACVGFGSVSSQLLVV